MTLHEIPGVRASQVTAIEHCLDTARKVKQDLRKYISLITEPYDRSGLDDSIFEFAELVGYRINNSRLDIAEDLDLGNKYGLSDKSLEPTISMTFRGHHNEDFMSDYQFEGLLGKETNDIIEGIRKSRGGLIGGRASIETHGAQMRNGGLIGGRKGGLIGGRATVETHGDQMRNGARKVADMINPETEERYVVEGGRKGGRNRMALLSEKERIELARKGGLIGGQRGLWRDNLERVLDIHNFREESIGKGFHSTKPSLDYVRDKMNEKHNENWTTNQVMKAYQQNKHLLADEEE